MEGEFTKTTLCFRCDRAYASIEKGCPWFLYGMPVIGWDAECRPLKCDDREVISYRVDSCPMFVPDPPRKFTVKDKSESLYLHNGEMLTLAEISERTGESPYEIERRFRTGNAWGSAQGPRKLCSEKHGHITQRELARIAGVSLSTVERRLRKGMTPDEIIELGKTSIGRRVLLECNGETHTYKEWAEITGIPASVIRARDEKGWSAEQVLSRPNVPGRSGFLEYNGETHTYKEWASIINVPAHLIRRRKSQGWTTEKILTTPYRENKE